MWQKCIERFENWHWPGTRTWIMSVEKCYQSAKLKEQRRGDKQKEGWCINCSVFLRRTPRVRGCTISVTKTTINLSNGSLGAFHSPHSPRNAHHISCAPLVSSACATQLGRGTSSPPPATLHHTPHFRDFPISSHAHTHTYTLQCIEGPEHTTSRSKIQFLLSLQ